VLLQVVHSNIVSDNLAVHVLNGKSDFKNPCLGQFYAPVVLDSGLKMQNSQWLTFLSEADAEDEELVAAAIKRIKKHVSRAYHGALNDLKYEKISVFHASHGTFSTSVDQMSSLVGFKNFFVISPTIGEAKNIPGLVLQAELCSEALLCSPGCHPA